jgi:hypothetical protein
LISVNKLRILKLNWLTFALPFDSLGSLLLFWPQFHPSLNVHEEKLTFMRIPRRETSLARRHSVRHEQTQQLISRL